MWRITWYSSVHAEHPLDHPSSFIILLGWSFYTNAPTSFQSHIKKILAKKFDIFVIMYLDDILICINDNREDHIAAVQ